MPKFAFNLLAENHLFWKGLFLFRAVTLFKYCTDYRKFYMQVTWNNIVNLSIWIPIYFTIRNLKMSRKTMLTTIGFIIFKYLLFLLLTIMY
jgi:hypothetical protein